MKIWSSNLTLLSIIHQFIILIYLMKLKLQVVIIFERIISIVCVMYTCILYSILMTFDSRVIIYYKFALGGWPSKYRYLTVKTKDPPPPPPPPLSKRKSCNCFNALPVLKYCSR